MGRFSYPGLFRLFILTAYHWREIDGKSAGQGLDPTSLPLRRFLNYVYTTFVENLTAEDREKFDTELFAPLPGTNPDAVTEAVVEEELAMFTALRVETAG